LLCLRKKERSGLRRPRRIGDMTMAGPTQRPSTQDEVNYSVWSGRQGVARYGAAKGWIDSSEGMILPKLVSEYAGGAVLDLGVGGGRTIGLASRAAGAFVAIDYVPELVQVARQRFPGVDIRVGDARRLDFAPESFDLVLFSINGIDAVSHTDRGAVLREVRRVLLPGGTFYFSTHNRSGPGPRERPWGPPPVTMRHPRSSVLSLLRRVWRFPVNVANYRRLRTLTELGPGWRVTTSGAHDFGIVIHYTTAAAAVAELREAGFAGPIRLWDDVYGTELSGDDPRLDGCWYFHVVARRDP